LAINFIKKKEEAGKLISDTADKAVDKAK